MVYADTSAVVKMLVDEPGSEIALAVFEGPDELTTSRVTYPEARAALAAAVRDRRLPDQDGPDAKRGLRVIMESSSVVELDEELADQAGELAERFELRGFDAIHLAAAIASAADGLATWDGDLAQAASAAGMRVLGAPTR
ncbi:MAG: type II toxin-antitoxin system VapC family toxin [Actinobacteria bacterium]|nr:type II toxin-antitoxin system VapC family toxin [Actinomycetota bacterium]